MTAECSMTIQCTHRSKKKGSFFVRYSGALTPGVRVLFIILAPGVRQLLGWGTGIIHCLGPLGYDN